ncbi:MAG: methyltransferase domain-containing protein, partial [Myxococcota bacterium]
MSQENRLSELYLGEFGEPTEQQRCKDRINWLCKQVRGPRVLDVGCSQGMASLLVARAGHDVTGIDIEAKPLQFARGLLRAEPRSVRARVTFETVDATQMPYEDGSYESAILGGILEYLAEPEAVLREVARVVEPLGTIAITAPLGLDPLPGSQRSFFLTSFLDLIESRFTVSEIKFAHGTLFAKVENAPSEAPLHSDPAQFAQLVRDFERECLKHQEEERRLLGQWSERYVELQQAKQALEADHESLRSDTTREAATQVEQIQSLETRAEQQESRADSLAAQFQQAETEVRQLSNQLTISQ